MDQRPMRTFARQGSGVRVAVSHGVALARPATGERRRRTGNLAWVLFQCIGDPLPALSARQRCYWKYCLLDKRVGPKCPAKFLFLQQVAAVADQKHQGVKGLGCENYKFVVAR